MCFFFSLVYQQPLVGQAAYEGDGTGSIPSDGGILADTPIYRLPLGISITDFTAGDNGEYIGTANGQTLLQTVNAATLITTHGTHSLSFNKLAHVYDVWKIGDGNTFSDINGLQVG